MDPISLDHRVKWVVHKGRKKLVINMSTLRYDDDLLYVFQKAFDQMRTEENVRYFLDMTNTYVSNKVVIFCINNLSQLHRRFERRAYGDLQDIDLLFLNRLIS